MDGLSKKELIILLEIISGCVSCISLKEFRGIVNKAGDLLQSGNIVFLSSRNDFKRDPPAIKEINISYPAEWTDIYRSQNFVKVDPITNLERSGLFFWKDVYREFPPDNEFLSQATSFGLSNGFSHIIAGKSIFGLMSIADTTLSKSRRNRTIINTLAPHLHQLAAKLVHQKACREIPRITPREREVLLWAMEGKTNWEISVILGISQESIKDYMTQILHKLDATNRAHAVAIALQNNLLLPQD
jgi:LuxR family transcriptional regulator, quorum-sensing system regulator CviR